MHFGMHAGFENSFRAKLRNKVVCVLMNSEAVVALMDVAC